MRKYHDKEKNSILDQHDKTSRYTRSKKWQCKLFRSIFGVSKLNFYFLDEKDVKLEKRKYWPGPSCKIWGEIGEFYS